MKKINERTVRLKQLPVFSLISTALLILGLGFVLMALTENLPSFGHMQTAAVISARQDCFSITTIPQKTAETYVNRGRLQEQLENIKETSVPGSVSCFYLSAQAAASSPTAYTQLAVDLSARYKRWLYVEGDLSIGKAINLSSHARISGKTSDGIAGSFSAGNQELPVLFRADQGAENVYLQNLTLTGGTQVKVALLQLVGMNTDIRVNTVTFKGSGSLDAGAGILLSGDWADDVTITASTFDGMSYGVHFIGSIQGLKLNRNEFTRWKHYAVRIASGSASAVRKSSNIQVSQNNFHDPVPNTTGGVLLVSRGTLRTYVENVTVASNIVVGSNVPFIPDQDETNATGDMLVLHGVDNFRIVSNKVFNGGENGITASRLSRNGIISNNEVYRNDGHGIAIGSGYYEVGVTNPSAYHQKDSVIGSIGGTKAEVESIHGNVLGLARVSGGTIFQLETTLANSTSGDMEAGKITSVSRTTNIKVQSNIIYDNGQDRANQIPFTYGVFVSNSDAISFVKNKIYNSDRGNPTQVNSISLVNSREITIEKSNVFEHGTVDIAKGVTKNSSSSLRDSR